MDLVQSRFVTDDVARLAAFYGRLTGTNVAANDYYVEVPTGRVQHRLLQVSFHRNRQHLYGYTRAGTPLGRINP